MGFMAIVNIIAILLLGKIAITCLKDYSAQKKQGKDPVFDPERLGIANADCWKAIVKDYKDRWMINDFYRFMHYQKSVTGINMFLFFLCFSFYNEKKRASYLTDREKRFIL